MVKARRGKGEGGIFYSNSKKRWIVRFQGRERVARSKAAAQLKLQDLQMGGGGKGKLGNTISVGEYLDAWVQQSESSHSQSTVANYKTTIRLHIKPFMGGLLLENLTAAHIEQWLLMLKVGQRTKQNAYTTLRAALGKAVRQDIIPSNPAQKVDRPKHHSAEVDPFTPAEMMAVLKACEGHRLEGLFQIAFRLGLRQAELFGLKWKNIDFEGRTLHVVQQNAEVAGTVYERRPKTDGSQRAIPLDDSCIEALNNRRRIAFAEGFAKDDDWVFPRTNGSPIVRSNFSRRTWKSLLKKAEVKHRGMHQCRHTAATIMLNAKVSPNVVARILGHSKPSTTLDIYARYIREAGEEAVAAVSAKLKGG